MAKRLYIVSVYHPELLDGLLLHLGASPDAQVVLDRRHGERRKRPRVGTPPGAERRGASVDRALREHGFAVIELDEPKPDA